MWTRLTWAAFFALALLLSCLGGRDRLPPGSICESRAECEQDLACLYGRCRESCTFDRDCPDGGACVPTESGSICWYPDDVSEARECPEGSRDVSGVCRELCTQVGEDYLCREESRECITDDGEPYCVDVSADDVDADFTTDADEVDVLDARNFDSDEEDVPDADEVDDGGLDGDQDDSSDTDGTDHIDSTPDVDIDDVGLDGEVDDSGQDADDSSIWLGCEQDVPDANGVYHESRGALTGDPAICVAIRFFPYSCDLRYIFMECTAIVDNSLSDSYLDADYRGATTRQYLGNATTIMVNLDIAGTTWDCFFSISPRKLDCRDPDRIRDSLNTTLDFDAFGGTS